MISVRILERHNVQNILEEHSVLHYHIRLFVITFFVINRVFMSVFSYWCVACEDAGWAVYSRLRLHVTGEYNCQQAGTTCLTIEHVAHHQVYTQRVSHVLAHVLAKVTNFESVASKMQREHAIAFSHLHERY